LKRDGEGGRRRAGGSGADRGIGQAMFQWSVQKIHLPQSLSEEANADELSD